MKINKNIEKSNFYGDLIFSTDYWGLFLAPDQTYLGTCVLILKRDCTGLRNLKKKEWIEFNELVKTIELGFMDTFDVTLFNWACAANLAFRDNETHIKPQVHWHMHPRYKNPVIFNGLKFIDENFGYAPRPSSKKLEDDLRRKIIEKIRENF
ncbi:HIT family protein [Methanobrevibacter sp. DSM 116169]|uniref:HIT family protein n=1 Tax=Methanobrevibacter sp. DSM 116169 TaxID=3242727 RepID=UPI0038FCD656